MAQGPYEGDIQRPWSDEESRALYGEDWRMRGADRSGFPDRPSSERDRADRPRSPKRPDDRRSSEYLSEIRAEDAYGLPADYGYSPPTRRPPSGPQADFGVPADYGYIGHSPDRASPSGERPDPRLRPSDSQDLRAPRRGFSDDPGDRRQPLFGEHAPEALRRFDPFRDAPRGSAPPPRAGDRTGSGPPEDGHRSVWDQTRDEVFAWMGDAEAARRRRRDEGLHRGAGPKDYVRSPERIREDVCERLSEDAVLDASHIEVKVDGPEVTLEGRVTRREDKRRAEDIADRVSGVRHVQNNLRLVDAVAPEGAPSNIAS